MGNYLFYGILNRKTGFSEKISIIQRTKGSVPPPPDIYSEFLFNITLLHVENLCGQLLGNSETLTQKEENSIPILLAGILGNDSKE